MKRAFFRRRIIHAFIFVSMLSGASTGMGMGTGIAHAQPAPASLTDTLKGDAKSDYESARILYNDGDHTAALLKFSAAYDKSHDARLLWNMAACEKSMRHYTRALRHVRAFAADTSGLVSDKDRAEAHELVKVMEPFTARLRVVVSEPGAEIAIDDEVIGPSPLAEPTVVDIGVRKVRVRKAGFRDVTRDVTVNGAEVTIELALGVHEGKLVVKSGNPTDAIAIDGKSAGAGSWSGPLTTGGHTLRVTAQGMKPYQTEILITDDQTREINITLEPESTRLPLWAWIAGGVVVSGGLAVGGYFLFRPEKKYEGPNGNLNPGFVYLGRPISFEPRF